MLFLGSVFGWKFLAASWKFGPQEPSQRSNFEWESVLLLQKNTQHEHLIFLMCVLSRENPLKLKKSTRSLRLWMAPPAAGGKITLVGSNKIITLHKHARTVTMTAVGCPSPSNFIFIGVMFWWVHLSYQSQSDTILQSTLGRIVRRRCFTGISPHDGNSSRLEF